MDRKRVISEGNPFGVLDTNRFSSEDSRLAQSSSKSNRDASTIIPWLDRDNSTMNSPEKTRPHTDIIFVSGVMSIFDGEIRNSALIQLLGWDTSVSSEIVARQLVEFGKSHKALLLKRSKEEEEQKEEEEKEEEEQKEEEKEEEKESTILKQTVSRLVPQLYRHLDEHFTQDVCEILQPNVPWIYSNTHDLFLPASKVAIQCPENSEPSLHVPRLLRRVTRICC